MMLDEIERFVRIVEAGSFTAAAKQLGVPKSTLSRALTRLEDAANVRLLQRSSRSLALTEAGRRFFELAGPHVVGMRDAVAQLRDAEEEPQGRVRLTMPADLAEPVAAEMLARFAARYPRVQVEIEVSSRVVNLLEEGYDAAIRAAVKLQDSSLVARKLGISEVHWYAAPSYLARRGTPTNVLDLAAHDLALHPIVTRLDGLDTVVAPRAPTRDAVALGSAVPRFFSADFAFLRGAIRGGGGIGALPSFLAQADLAEGRLVRVLPSWAQAAGSVWFVHPSGKHAPKKVLALRDFLAESFAASPSFSAPASTGRGASGKRGRGT